jgi:MFS family permease
MAAILYLPGTSHFQLSFFILGVSAAGQSIGFATIAEQFKKQFLAVGFGFNNMCITVFSALNAPTIGLLLDQASAGNPVSLENYLDVFSLLIVMAVLAVLVSAFFVKETFCKSNVDFTILKKHNEQIVAY